MSQKKALGFDKGYITIFKGVNEENETFFQKSNARFARFWGWYVVSTEETPFPLPVETTPIKLPWEMVGGDNEELFPEQEVVNAVNALIYHPSPSQFVGSVGQRLSLTLKVTQNRSLKETSYGKSVLHVMRDADENEFVWVTAAKDWPVGSVHNLRGTVKTHQVFQNTKQTVLTRCLESR